MVCGGLLVAVSFAMMRSNSSYFNGNVIAEGHNYFGICVSETDVKDAIGSSRPETSNQKIPTFVFGGRFLSVWFLLVGFLA
jgi:hypothetical protein